MLPKRLFWLFWVELPNKPVVGAVGAAEAVLELAVAPNPVELFHVELPKFMAFF